MKKPRDKVEFTLRILCIVSSILFVVGIVIDCIYGNNENYSQYSSLTQNITGLCANLAISYLFYIIAFLPEERKKRSVNRVINYYLSKMYVEYNEIIRVCDSIGDTSIELESSPNIRTVVEENNGRIFISYNQHFINYYYKSLELRRELLPFSDYLDDKVRNLLYDYINTSFFRNIKSMLIDNPTSMQKKIFVANLNKMYSELKVIGGELFADRSRYE